MGTRVTRWVGIGAVALASTAVATTANAQSPSEPVGAGLMQTSDGSTFADEESPSPAAIGAVVASLVAAIAATFVVRSRRSQ